MNIADCGVSQGEMTLQKCGIGLPIWWINVLSILIKGGVLMEIREIFHCIEPFIAVVFVVNAGRDPVKVRSQNDLRESAS